MYYIYLIVNKVNGKTYVGQRESSKEWYEDKYMGSGKLLGPAKKKYGIKNFEKFLIQYCYSKEETDKAEKFWIAEYRRRGKAEYNIADGGQGGALHKGKCHSEETKRKLSDLQKGRHHSEEQNRKHSEAMKGKNNPFYGKSHSEETKRKISESKKGKHWYNNGKISVRAKECPEGFVKGRLSTNKGKHWKLVNGKRVYY